MSKTKTMVAGNTIVAADLTQNFDELGMLGYAEVTANQGTFTADTDLTNLTVTVTISASFATAARKIRIRGYVRLTSSVAGDVGECRIKEGATQLGSADVYSGGGMSTCIVEVVIAPTSGNHTYKLSALRGAGTGNITMNASATSKAFILCEAI